MGDWGCWYSEPVPTASVLDVSQSQEMPNWSSPCPECTLCIINGLFFLLVAVVLLLLLLVVVISVIAAELLPSSWWIREWRGWKWCWWKPRTSSPGARRLGHQSYQPVAGWVHSFGDLRPITQHYEPSMVKNYLSAFCVYFCRYQMVAHPLFHVHC